MAIVSIRISLSILFISLLITCTLAYNEHKEWANFSYSGSNGPDKWGSLSPNFSDCSKGKAQSPVDLTMANIIQNKQLKPLDRNYSPANATLVNNGFNIGVHFDGDVGGITIDGKRYSLIQMHWHSPSEHHLEGKQLDAELHLVHKADDRGLAVVAVLHHFGDSDPMISKIKDKLIELGKKKPKSDEEAHIALGTFDVKWIKRNSHKYYRYVGSLTTPPCKEKVIWTILGKVRSISKKQIDLLKAPLGEGFKNNARPLQPLNGRKIEMRYDNEID
ncbi:hypothetical protein L6164_033855 [Bauhinia variegata]|uniref:Uncharacterized protein n=1 Tax=Bauhinia variegata TaxID=167791 RepID=A0ACB9KT60_BAUVA|nr:hypothetical protein L6164_033855 [Bauhinia variegata]